MVLRFSLAPFHERIGKACPQFQSSSNAVTASPDLRTTAQRNPNCCLGSVSSLASVGRERTRVTPHVIGPSNRPAGTYTILVMLTIDKFTPPNHYEEQNGGIWTHACLGMQPHSTKPIISLSTRPILFSQCCFASLTVELRSRPGLFFALLMAAMDSICHCKSWILFQSLAEF